ncbi:MAG: tetratricopeptide repeat protein [Hormoscilla sp. GUM202]|nr:tetratricopeptide repeat protein [Hormoscilla sp. GUM202]
MLDEHQDKKIEVDSMETHGTQTAVKDNITAETKIDDLQQELSRARSRGDRPAEAKALADLGTAYGWRSEYALAIACLEQSLAIAREQGNKEAEWRLLWDLGVTYEKYGKLEEVLAAFTQAEDMTKEFGYAFENIPEPSLLTLRYSSEFGRKMWINRQKFIASGMPLLTSEEIAQELNERRGIRG